MINTSKILILILLAAFVAGCAAPASSTPVAIPAQPSATPTPVPAATATDQPKNLPGATATDPADQPTVTLDDNNKTINLQSGDHFLLKLGETYNWTVESPDTDVVSRVRYIMAVRGSQGLFTAHQAGTAVLTARGDPPCRSSKPACMIPSITFQVNLVVK